jgi:hypothetical protein
LVGTFLAKLCPEGLQQRDKYLGLELDLFE